MLKGISWRLVATSTTVAIAGGFLQDWGLAAAIGGTEAFSKLLLYYVHERAWQLVPPGAVVRLLKRGRPDTSSAARYRESRWRSVFKAISWRVVATGTTMAIAWGATSDAAIAAWIGSVEAVAKLGLYYGHERVWQLLPRGTVRRALLSSNTHRAPEPPSPPHSS